MTRHPSASTDGVAPQGRQSATGAGGRGPGASVTGARESCRGQGARGSRTSAQAVPCRLAAIWRPVARPAGRARGARPSTGQRSPRRGVKPTSTRPPGWNAIWSCSWAMASSYAIEGRCPTVSPVSATPAGVRSGARVTVSREPASSTGTPPSAATATGTIALAGCAGNRPAARTAASTPEASERSRGSVVRDRVTSNLSERPARSRPSRTGLPGLRSMKPAPRRGANHTPAQRPTPSPYGPGPHRYGGVGSPLVGSGAVRSRCCPSRCGWVRAGWRQIGVAPDPRQCSGGRGTRTGSGRRCPCRRPSGAACPLELVLSVIVTL